MARAAAESTGERNACLAGGVALNCVANGVLLREGPFENIWIQPAAGDAGGAVGAALYGWHQILDNPRDADDVHDGMQGAYLGPRFGSDEIAAWLDERGYPYERLSGDGTRRAHRRCDRRRRRGRPAAGTHGVRAAGARAPLDHRRPALARDAVDHEPQDQVPRVVPAVRAGGARGPGEQVLRHRTGIESPYMLLVADVRPELRVDDDRDHERGADLRTWVNEVRSRIPAVTHVDYSARLQTVARDTSPEFHAIIEAFDRLTGCPVVINTSFNVRGEPIVCTPEDAYRCFMRTEMDTLVLEDCILRKRDQPEFADTGDWEVDFILD